VISNNGIHERTTALAPHGGNGWQQVGDAHSVVGFCLHQGRLYCVSNNSIWARNRIGPGSGNDWEGPLGDALGVIGLTSFQGSLVVVSNNKMWKRGRIGPGTGNDWQEIGDAFGVTGFNSAFHDLLTNTGLQSILANSTARATTSCGEEEEQDLALETSGSKKATLSA